MNRVALLIAALICLLPLSHARAANAPHTWLVTSSADDGGAGTLRAILTHAAAGDSVEFSLHLDGTTITLTQGVLDLSRSVAIMGPGAGPQAMTIDAAGHSSVFRVEPGVTAQIYSLTITGGHASIPGQGGGIDNHGTIYVHRCQVLANTAVQGGGILNAGSMLLHNSQVERNSADDGGGIDNLAGATLTVDSSAVNHNTTPYLDGGLDRGGGISNLGNLQIVGSQVNDNEAIQEAGIVNAGILVARSVVVLGNVADMAIGGIESSGTASFTGGQIGDNVSTYGTMQVENDGTMHLDSLLLGDARPYTLQIPPPSPRVNNHIDLVAPAVPTTFVHNVTLHATCQGTFVDQGGNNWLASCYPA